MARRRRAFIFGVATLVLSVGLVAQEQLDKKQDDALKKEAQALSKLADAALAAQGSATEFDLAWAKEDFLKGPQGKQFVPFTVTIDPSKVPSGEIALYWRVAKPAPPADPTKKADNKRVDPIWEGASFVKVDPAQKPMRLSRSFVAPAGEYDLYVVAKEVQIEKPKNAAAPKTAVLKQTVTVPEFWNEELNTSSVIVTERIDPLPAPLSPAQLTERPYAALGVLEVVPVATTKFTKKNELSVFFLIYNTKADGTNKPDVNIEYAFCQMAPGNQPAEGEPCKAGEKFYNKTEPQSMNAQTLPPQFDLSMGHQLQTGQAVPLAGFPEGDYRLEIKVTDKLANKSITRDVNFSVSAS
jgi:hypothetical protein